MRLVPRLKAVSARSRAFIGRDDERRRLAHWIHSAPAPTKVVDITGLGGVGKSTLLDVLLHDGENLGAHTAWIDGRACFGTPEGIRQNFPPALLQWMQDPTTDTKWIVGIDNFEVLRDVSDWLRRDLLASAPAFNLLILVCERKTSLMQWRLDLDWAGRVEEWALKPFTTDETVTFLRRRGIPVTGDVAEIAQVPLSLAIYADLYRRGAINQESVQVARAAFSVSLLREVLHPSWHEAVNVLSMVSRAHLDFLNAVLDQPLSVADYRQVASLSFVTDAPGGLGIHDLVARELLRDFRRRQPDAFQRLRKKVIMALATAWQRLPERREDGRLAHDLVRLVGRDLELWRDYADLYEDPRGLDIVPYEPRHRAAALHCLTEWARPAIPMTVAQQAALFDRVADNKPDTIRLVREPSGRCVALICLLPIARDSLKLLRVVVPDIVSRLVSHPDLDIDVSRHDTRLVAMVGLATHDPLYPTPLLAGTVLRYTLESSGGLRTLGMVIDRRLTVLLEKLGWMAYPFPLHSEPDLLLYSLDLRFEHIPRWAARITGVAFDVPSTPQNPLKSLGVAELRRLLGAYHDAVRFQQLAESHHLAIPVEQVRGLLREALQAFGNEPYRAEAADLIRQSYLDPHPATRLLLAHGMNISRATFHRYLSRAVAEFTQFIHQRV
jgi:hypothetical protein